MDAGGRDERGALNALTDEIRLAATRTARTGKLYELGLPIEAGKLPTLPHRPQPERRSLAGPTDTPGAQPGTGGREDVITLPTHSGTHIDALSHIHTDNLMYNGFSAVDEQDGGGITHLGIEKVGPIVTRGVLLDIARQQGVDWLAPGYVVTPENLGTAMSTQRTDVRTGDVVLIRTGWLESFLHCDGEVPPDQPGIGIDAARMLADLGVVAVGADNTAVEVKPFDRGVYVAVHVELLVRRGIYLIEHLRLDELAADRCFEFLFGLCPLPVVGASGSPVNPFAVG